MLRRNFIGSRDLYIPEIYWPYCREPVLVMGRLEFGEAVGAPDLGDEEEGGPDYSRKAQIIAAEVIPLPEARSRAAQTIQLRVDAAHARPTTLDELKLALQRNPGACRSFLNIVRGGCTNSRRASSRFSCPGGAARSARS